MVSVIIRPRRTENKDFLALFSVHQGVIQNSFLRLCKIAPVSPITIIFRPSWEID